MKLHKGEETEETYIHPTKEGMLIESWKIAEVLEHRFHGWDSRRYIIAMLIYRYLSQEMEQFTEGRAQLLCDESKYRTMDDEEAEALTEEASSSIGFFIPPSGLFCNVYRDAPIDGNLGKTLEWVFSDIEESSIGFANESVFRNQSSHLDLDGSGLDPIPKKRKKKLYCLMKEVSNVCSDAISDMASTFEFILDQYSRPMATGEGMFEVRLVPDLLILLVCRGRKDLQSFYDPYCGPGVLLSHARSRLASEGCLYGQSETITEYNLARSFMFLIHLDPTRFSLAYGDSLTSFDTFGGCTFDMIASILPKRKRWVGDDDLSLVKDRRFSPAGVLAPKSKADLAYVMHSVSCLSECGTAAFALSEGSLSRERSEKEIRRWLLDNNLVDAVIRIPTDGLQLYKMHRYVLVVRKGRSERTILFINASSQKRNKSFCFVMVGEISHIFNERKEVPNYSRLVDRSEVLANGCDLTPFLYVERSHPCGEEMGTSLSKALEEISTELASLAFSSSSLESLVRKLELAPLQPVGALAIVKMGKNAKANEFIDAPEGIDYVRISDLACRFSENTFVNHSALKVSPNAASTRIFERNTVLIPKNATSIKSGRRGILSKRSAVDGNLLCLVPRGELLEEYLLHSFGSWTRSVWLKRTDRKEILRLSDTLDAMIKVPSATIQKQVNETIGSLEKSERLMKKKSYLLRRLLVKRLEELIASTSDEPRVPISAVAEVLKIPGYKYNKFVRYSESGTCIALRGCNVKNGRLDLSSSQRLDDKILYEISCALLHKGDILFTFVGTPGHVAVVDSDDRYYLEPDVALIKVDKTKVLPEYLCYWYQNSPACRIDIASDVKPMGRRSIPFDRIRKFKVSLPPLGRQQEIVEELETGFIARITEVERAMSESHRRLEMVISKLTL
ncbi:MAG: N-6 DNA methylase [Sphaerochaeta sp.]|nr:N-6 DNA methylase [Sphaerochaeta sp.]